MLKANLNTTYNKTEVNNAIALKQNLLNNGNTINLDVGRGEVYLENNVNDLGDGIGSGICLRTSSNNINGSIFSIGSHNNAPRFWVGNSLTSSGIIWEYVQKHQMKKWMKVIFTIIISGILGVT